MRKSEIAILIPVHNGLGFTSKCLRQIYSLLSGKPLVTTAFHVVVIDDGSNDGTEEWIRTNYPETTILSGDGNLWWSGAINKGTGYALNELKCDYVLWWNNDISASPDYFENLEHILTEKAPEIAGSKIYFAHDPTMVWSMGGIFDTRNGKKHMTGMNEKDGEQFSKVHYADWLPGMGTIVHRSVVEKIGMLDDKNFPQYHGDSDFTFRARLSGYEIPVYPQLKIWNDKSNSGLMHRNNLNLLIRSLKDIKSNYHLGKDILFYRLYSTSVLAYQTLAIKYCLYVGGFIKWRVLSLFGIRKNRLPY
ncbi:MAG: putative glycosyltransferase [Bacteroidetes bacterium]|nr:MAG: putative glycosyltransferase [Bacteroidota bacterium]